MVRETRHLWVGNLPDNIREDRIREHFKRYGRVQNVKLLGRTESPSGVTSGGGCATVAFMDIKSAAKAHNAEHVVDERTLTTEYYEPTAIPSVAGAPSAGSSPAGSGYSGSSSSVNSAPATTASVSRYHLSGGEDSATAQCAIAATAAAPVTWRGTNDSATEFCRRGSTPATYGRYQRTTSGATAPYATPPSNTDRCSGGGGSGTTRWYGGSGGGGESTPSTPGGAEPARRRRRSGSGSSRSDSSSPDGSDASRASTPPVPPPAQPAANHRTPTSSHHQWSSSTASGRPLAICVRNLPTRSTDSSLKDGLYHEYKKHGKVVWVKIVGQNADRYAVVRFKKPSDVEKALEVSQDKLFFGCKISVAPHQSCDDDTDSVKPYETDIDEYHPKATRTLFIGNLEKEVTQQQIRDKFKHFGRIIEVDIKKGSGGGAGYAFCQFASISSVVDAIRAMDGEYVGGARVKLGFGKPVATTCVWVDGLTEHTEKQVLGAVGRCGTALSLCVDRAAGAAIVQFEQAAAAGACVRELRRVAASTASAEPAHPRITVDYASRECQPANEQALHMMEAFYEQLEKHGGGVAPAVGGERAVDARLPRLDSLRYEGGSRSRASSYGRGASRTPRYNAIDHYDSGDYAERRYRVYEELGSSPATEDIAYEERLQSVVVSPQRARRHRRDSTPDERKHSKERHRSGARRSRSGSVCGSRHGRRRHRRRRESGSPRAGTPLRDEPGGAPAEPRRPPRERPPLPMCLPLPKFAAQLLRARPPTPRPAPESPPRAPSVASSSSGSAPHSPSLEERIRSLDEKYERWSGSRAAADATDRARPRHRLLDVDVHEVPPSDVVRSLLAKRSVFDEDSERLEGCPRAGVPLDPRRRRVPEPLDEPSKTPTQRQPEEPSRTSTQRLLDEPPRTLTPRLFEETPRISSQRSQDELSRTVTQRLLDESTRTLSQRVLDEPTRTSTLKLFDDPSKTPSQRLLDEANRTPNQKLQEEPSRTPTQKIIDDPLRPFSRLKSDTEEPSRTLYKSLDELSRPCQRLLDETPKTPTPRTPDETPRQSYQRIPDETPRSSNQRTIDETSRLTSHRLHEEVNRMPRPRTPEEILKPSRPKTPEKPMKSSRQRTPDEPRKISRQKTPDEGSKVSCPKPSEQPSKILRPATPPEEPPKPSRQRTPEEPPRPSVPKSLDEQVRNSSQRIFDEITRTIQKTSDELSKKLSEEVMRCSRLLEENTTQKAHEDTSRLSQRIPEEPRRLSRGPDDGSRPSSRPSSRRPSGELSRTLNQKVKDEIVRPNKIESVNRANQRLSEEIAKSMNQRFPDASCSNTCHDTSQSVIHRSSEDVSRSSTHKIHEGRRLSIDLIPLPTSTRRNSVKAEDKEDKDVQQKSNFDSILKMEAKTTLLETKQEIKADPDIVLKTDKKNNHRRSESFESKHKGEYESKNVHSKISIKQEKEAKVNHENVLNNHIVKDIKTEEQNNHLEVVIGKASNEFFNMNHDFNKYDKVKQEETKTTINTKLEKEDLENEKPIVKNSQISTINTYSSNKILQDLEKSIDDRIRHDRERSLDERAKNDRDKTKHSRDRTEREKHEKDRTEREKHEKDRTDKDKNEKDRTDRDKHEKDRHDHQHKHEDKTKSSKHEKSVDKHEKEKRAKDEHSLERSRTEKESDKSHREKHDSEKAKHSEDKSKYESHRKDKVEKEKKKENGEFDKIKKDDKHKHDRSDRKKDSNENKRDKKDGESSKSRKSSRDETAKEYSRKDSTDSSASRTSHDSTKVKDLENIEPKEDNRIKIKHIDLFQKIEADKEQLKSKNKPVEHKEDRISDQQLKLKNDNTDVKNRIEVSEKQRHYSLDSPQVDAKRKERLNSSSSLPSHIGHKRRMSSQDSLELSEEVKKSRSDAKIPERRESKDSRNSDRHKAPKFSKGHFAKLIESKTKDEKKNQVKPPDDSFIELRDSDVKDQKTFDKSKPQKKTNKDEIDDKQSHISNSFPLQVSQNDLDFLATLELRSSEEDEKQKALRKEMKEKKRIQQLQQIQELQMQQDAMHQAELMNKNKEDKKQKSDEKKKEAAREKRMSTDRKSREEKVEQRQRKNSKKQTQSTDSSDTDEPKKHSIFDIVDDGPTYISMYDKVKARSCKNMQKQEEEKRQEKIKAKFSQLKQSRAKREEKKRSSWDEDSDSDQDRRRHQKTSGDTSSDDEEVHSKKRDKSHRSSEFRRNKISGYVSNEDDACHKLSRKNSRTRIMSDSSEDDTSKRSTSPSFFNDLKKDLSDFEIIAKKKDEDTPPIKDFIDDKIKKNSLLNLFGKSDSDDCKLKSSIETDTDYNTHFNKINSNDLSSESESMPSRRNSSDARKKHKKKQKKYKFSLSDEETRTENSEPIHPAINESKHKHDKIRRSSSKKEKRREKVHENNTLSNTHEEKPHFKKDRVSPVASYDPNAESASRKDGKMEDIFGPISDESDRETKRIHEKSDFQSHDYDSTFSTGTDICFVPASDDAKIKDKEDNKRKKEKRRKERKHFFREDDNSLDVDAVSKAIEARLFAESVDSLGKHEKQELKHGKHEESNTLEFSKMTKYNDKIKEKKKKKKRSKEDKQNRKDHHHSHHRDQHLSKPEQTTEDWHLGLSPKSLVLEDIPLPAEPHIVHLSDKSDDCKSLCESPSLPRLVDSPPIVIQSDSQNTDIKDMVSDTTSQIIIDESDDMDIARKNDIEDVPTPYSIENFVPDISEVPLPDGPMPEKCSESRLQPEASSFDMDCNENAVRSITNLPSGEDKTKPVEKQESPKIEKKAEEKPRVVISQEETEDAVAALLGESFGGKDSSFDTCFDEIDNSSIHQTDSENTTVENENIPEEDAEEMRRAVQNLNACEMELKPDTPVSDSDLLLIDTDSEETEEVAVESNEKPAINVITSSPLPVSPVDLPKVIEPTPAKLIEVIPLKPMEIASPKIVEPPPPNAIETSPPKTCETLPPKPFETTLPKAFETTPPKPSETTSPKVFETTPSKPVENPQPKTMEMTTNILITKPNVIQTVGVDPPVSVGVSMHNVQKDPKAAGTKEPGQHMTSTATPVITSWTITPNSKIIEPHILNIQGPLTSKDNEVKPGHITANIVQIKAAGKSLSRPIITPYRVSAPYQVLNHVIRPPNSAPPALKVPESHILYQKPGLVISPRGSGAGEGAPRLAILTAAARAPVAVVRVQPPTPRPAPPSDRLLAVPNLANIHLAGNKVLINKIGHLTEKRDGQVQKSDHPPFASTPIIHVTGVTPSTASIIQTSGKPIVCSLQEGTNAIRGSSPNVIHTLNAPRLLTTTPISSILHIETNKTPPSVLSMATIRSPTVLTKMESSPSAVVTTPSLTNVVMTPLLLKTSHSPTTIRITPKKLSDKMEDASIHKEFVDNQDKTEEKRDNVENPSEPKEQLMIKPNQPPVTPGQEHKVQCNTDFEELLKDRTNEIKVTNDPDKKLEVNVGKTVTVLTNNERKPSIECVKKDESLIHLATSKSFETINPLILSPAKKDSVSEEKSEIPQQTINHLDKKEIDTHKTESKPEIQTQIESIFSGEKIESDQRPTDIMPLLKNLHSLSDDKLKSLDDDSWSAKDVNIESVIKKVDSLCNDNDLVESKNKEPEPGPTALRRSSVTQTQVTCFVTKESENTPMELEPDNLNFNESFGVIKSTGPAPKRGGRSARGKRAEKKQERVQTRQIAKPARGAARRGRGRAKLDKKVKSGADNVHNMPGDVYDFHEDSGDEAAATKAESRPRLILTIKSPLSGQSNAVASSTLSIAQKEKLEKSNAIKDDKAEDFASPSSNTRKSRRLQEKDVQKPSGEDSADEGRVGARGRRRGARGGRAAPDTRKSPRGAKRPRALSVSDTSHDNGENRTTDADTSKEPKVPRMEDTVPPAVAAPAPATVPMSTPVPALVEPPKPERLPSPKPVVTPPKPVPIPPKPVVPGPAPSSTPIMKPPKKMISEISAKLASAAAAGAATAAGAEDADARVHSPALPHRPPHPRPQDRATPLLIRGAETEPAARAAYAATASLPRGAAQPHHKQVAVVGPVHHHPGAASRVTITSVPAISPQGQMALSADLVRSPPPAHQQTSPIAAGDGMYPHFSHQHYQMYQQHFRATQHDARATPSPYTRALEAEGSEAPTPPLELRRPPPSARVPRPAHSPAPQDRLIMYAVGCGRSPPPAHGMTRGALPAVAAPGPPHASQVPREADSLHALLTRYPVMWQGLLALKNDAAAVQMHFVGGNARVAGDTLPRHTDGSTPPLRIAQRMRLEPPQLDQVQRKMKLEHEHCILLALPCGRDHMDVLQQSKNLSTGFITYLQRKQAAGIVNVAPPGHHQAMYTVHIFPTCEFANENLNRFAPDLMHRVADIAHLLIVIATV